MELLRFFTAGNVDDGKSTLIGRLLYDSNSISTDIIETLSRQSKIKTEDSKIDLALLTDGLRAEREQGITIDVAYKFFSTPKRKFIIADTPGHFQYTRNMFTGSSNSDLAIILIDARIGITEQTRRHTILSSVIGIPHLTVCINKMDMVDFSEESFLKIKNEFLEFSSKLNLEDIQFFPISALQGDNVVNPSKNMNWYSGPPLLKFLEDVTIKSRRRSSKSRLQVQYVIRPQTKELPDYRGYAGTVSGGKFFVGQKVKILPAVLESKISRIELKTKDVSEAEIDEPIVLHLETEIDISRGDWIVEAGGEIQSGKELKALLLWMDNDPFRSDLKYILQQSSFQTKVKISSLDYKISYENYFKETNINSLNLNELAGITLKTADPVFYDSYEENHNSGSFILINESTNSTVAAGVFI